MNAHSETMTETIHGSRANYKTGCRCTECRDANRVYVAANRAKANTEPEPAVIPQPRTVAIHKGETWRDHAACRGSDVELFYAAEASGRGYGQGARREQETAAVTICHACPVISACRRFALTTGERFGIWGGMTEPERAYATGNYDNDCDHLIAGASDLTANGTRFRCAHCNRDKGRQ